MIISKALRLQIYKCPIGIAKSPIISSWTIIEIKCNKSCVIGRTEEFFGFSSALSAPTSESRRKKKIEEYFEKERKTSCHEYFLYCFKEDVETLFGETFAQMAEAMTARQSLEIKQLLEIRAKKRGPNEVESLAKKAKVVVNQR